ncbi:MAG: DUF2975 domain-containing protein [Lachnospiraceae bacterium]|nr:DUF2975 domain-containing protein [Lachnospiraceae bacterium]
MKLIQKLTSEPFARAVARCMKFICYFVISFFVLCTALSFLGRQTFFLHTKTGTFENAIYAEKIHGSYPRGMTVHMGDEIHVWTNDGDQISPAIHVGLSLMYAIHVVPMVFAFWFLSRVFSNIQKRQIFTEQNATYLLYYGLLQFSVAVFVPFIKLLICWLISLVSDSQISLSTGQATFHMLFPSLVFLVAAYIIHYGVHLQDEVDHTL